MIQAERLVNPDGTYNLGQFALPLAEANLAEAPIEFFASFLSKWGLGSIEQRLKAFRLKEWQYYSISHPDIFLALAVANLHYVGHIFVYAVDRRYDVMLFERNLVLPLGRHITFEGSSLSGKVRYKNGLDHIDLDNRMDSGLREIHINLLPTQKSPLIKARLQIFDTLQSQPLVVATSLPKQRLSYTHKMTGLPVAGEMTLDRKSYTLNKQQTLASLDWTRAFSARHTHWNWASASGFLEGSQDTVGFNFVNGVNEEPVTENAFWIQQHLVKIDKIYFEFDRHKLMNPWQISSNDERVALRFEPLGQRKDKQNFGLVKSDFHQLFGYFDGILKDETGQVHQIKRLFGVTEDHDALW